MSRILIETGYQAEVSRVLRAMDIDPFTSPTFDPTTYLNQLLPPSNPDTYYTTASSVLPNLELLARNTNADLTSALTSLLRTSIRLGIDMETLKHDSRALAMQTTRVEQDVAGIQLESGVMSELALLEVVQERMRETMEIFLKAGQWTIQTDEGIRFLIDSGGYDVASQRIAELRQMVGIWEGTAEFKDRLERIEILERTLLNAQKPATPVTSPTTTSPELRGTVRAQSRLRVDSSDAILRESGGGIFGQFRQNIGR
jgi:hypothetical protein